MARLFRRPLRRWGALVTLALGAALLPVVVSSPGQAAEETAVVFTRLPGFTLTTGERTRVVPAHYTAYRVDLGQAGDVLAKAPARSAVARGADQLTFAVPDPAGRLVRFRVQEDSVMEPGLQARHPEIHTYAGRGIDDPTRTIRLDVTPMGFHAAVRSPGGRRAWYVDPAYNRRGATTHLSYYGSSVPRPRGVFVERDLQDTTRALALAPVRAARATALVVQRTYRLAFVTDPTYADYFGTANVAAEKVTLVNRVDQVYNDDLAVELVLIDDTDMLNLDTQAEATGVDGPCGAHGCYDAADLDPVTGGCSDALIRRNEFVLGQIVGADGYDIGHLGLGINGGGLAGLGVVGGAAKARGCTGLPNPQGDSYAIDYVSHEIGHQFGGDHTFNGVNVNCAGGNRYGPTSVEPGSGSSVMAYAGICGPDDLQPHSDPYFSQRSIDEITATVTATPGTVNERQVVNLRDFNVDGESFQLTYPGAAPVTLTRGSSYTATGIRNAVQDLTGFTPSVSGYDGASSPGNAGFTLTFGAGSGAAGQDLDRFGVTGVSDGVSGFVGTIYQGGASGNRGSMLTTGNHAPSVAAPMDRTIPVRTPFTLTGSGSDDDGNALTYLWEQNDRGGTSGTGLLSNTKANGPLFRVFGTAAQVSPAASLLSPSPGENIADGSPSRTFPDLAQVLAGNTNAATGSCPAGNVTCFSEFLPTAGYTAGVLDFRLTARDGYPGGGGTSYDDVRLTLDTTAGPLLVTSQATPGTLTAAGGSETVTWAVNNTNKPALAPNVKISLSTDGGQTFPDVLAASTPNDGTETVTLPEIDTDHARIRVEAVDNYFFDLNDGDFAIHPTKDTDPPETTITSGPASTNGFALDAQPLFTYSSEPTATFECHLDSVVVSCGSGAVRLAPVAPGTHVFTVAARDSNGLLDPTPARRVFATPYGARGLTRATGGWQLRTSTSAYRGAYLRAASKDQVLTRGGSNVKRIALVVGTGPGFGRVAVYFRGVRVRTISLAATSRHARVLRQVANFAEARSGLVRIRTLSGRTVRIEGLGIFSRP